MFDRARELHKKAVDEMLQLALLMLSPDPKRLQDSDQAVSAMEEAVNRSQADGNEERTDQFKLRLDSYRSAVTQATPDH